MTSQEQTAADLASLKPFRLVKFFSFSGLTVFLVFTLVLSWVISNHAKQVLLERSEGYALVFAENLSHQVFQQFVLPTVLRYGQIALRNPSQFKRLDTIVRNTAHGLKIKSVTIFDSQENVISYSTIEGRVGSRDEGGVEYEKALQGINNSRLVFEGSLLNLLPGTEEISGQLITYIPFRQERPLSQSTDLIMGVIELVQDLSDDFEAILRLQGMIILTSVLIMSALFIVLRFIVARADRIIEARAIERRRLEEKLHQSERLASLGKMVAAVSHEIKNPLGIVRSTAEILRKRISSVAPGNEHLATIIIDETARLDGIVREFLDFASPQTPRLTLVALNDIVAKALSFMESELERQGIELETSYDESLDVLRLDEGLFYRALLNILINAVQAMPHGGQLRVATRRPAPLSAGAVVEISDTGGGMSADKQRQIFNPFFTDKYRGTGLGLAIAKNIIDGHRGGITVESEEGRGTTFRITMVKL
jgi:two-component system, NtrC family, sensor histidine kinase HydH